MNLKNKYQECYLCKTTQNLNNFIRRKDGKYYRMCIECNEEVQKEKLKKKKKKNLHTDTHRTCYKCQRFLSNDNFTRRSVGTYFSACKECNKLLELQKQIKEQQEATKKLEEQERFISEQRIPDLMQQAGVRSIELTDGYKVDLRQVVSAKIPASKTEEAFTWMRENGYGDLIKNQMTTNFSRSQDNEAAALYDELVNRGFTVSRKEKIEPMTLKGFARERIQNGENIDMALLGVYVGNQTKITKKE